MGQPNLPPIPFNKPFIAGKELFYIAQAVTFGNISGDGHFTKACCQLLEQRFNIPKVLLTPSCTAALEMAAMLCRLQPGDEVIMPSYTFVSTANAFVREGARPVFVDIRPDTLNIDEELIEAAITPRTRAICPVHYAGVPCEMDRIMEIAEKHNLMVIEDAAQAVNSWYKGRACGSIGHLGCYSFHETKNYTCGEGGALCINRPNLIDRAEIIRDKGTNRKQFFRGLVDKYTWVDVGSSYVPSEIASAFLFGQLEHMDRVTTRRKELFDEYVACLAPLESAGLISTPRIPLSSQGNYHLCYILLNSEQTRNDALTALVHQQIYVVFHYVPLHLAPYAQVLHTEQAQLPKTVNCSGRLLRLPMFHDLTLEEVRRVTGAFDDFFRDKGAVVPKPHFSLTRTATTSKLPASATERTKD
ncbi:MAG: Lipopolysaccharide biosynthesis protein RffA [Planctomycetaceae bacterium]|nr:Lipopolysaccharide biosynthesis protein RffA [Planctomycetaceae bacterium]